MPPRINALPHRNMPKKEQHPVLSNESSIIIPAHPERFTVIDRQRKARRDLELEEWDLKQAPPPVSDADTLEEELARAAHGRIRAWAKALLECNEAYLDTFGSGALHRPD